MPNRSVKRTKRQDEKLGGGIQFARAWIYDGFQWNEIEDMSEPRDRPACSLVQLEDGAVSNILLCKVFLMTFIARCWIILTNHFAGCKRDNCLHAL